MSYNLQGAVCGRLVVPQGVKESTNNQGTQKFKSLLIQSKTAVGKFQKGLSHEGESRGHSSVFQST